MTNTALTHTIWADLAGLASRTTGYLRDADPVAALQNITSQVDLDSGVTRTWGREDRFAEMPSPGTLSFTVDNKSGEFTPGNPLKVWPRGIVKGTLIVWEVTDGTVMRRLKYRVESATVVFPNGAANSTQVQITCRDVLGQLATTLSRSALETDILNPGYYSTRPTYYWALDEGGEAVAAAESSGNRGPEQVVKGYPTLFDPNPISWGSGGGPGGDGKGALQLGKDLGPIVMPDGFVVNVASMIDLRRTNGSSIARGAPYLAPATDSLPTPDPWVKGQAAFANPAIGDKVMLAVECWALAEWFEPDTVSAGGTSPYDLATLWELTLGDGTVATMNLAYNPSANVLGYELRSRRGTEAMTSITWGFKTYTLTAARAHAGRTHHIYWELVQTFTQIPTPGASATASYTHRLWIDGVLAWTYGPSTTLLPARNSVKALRPLNLTIGGGKGDLTYQQGSWMGTIGRVALYNEARRNSQSADAWPWMSELPNGPIDRVLIGQDNDYGYPFERIQYLLERIGLPYGSYPDMFVGHSLLSLLGSTSYPSTLFQWASFSVDGLGQANSAEQTWLEVLADTLRQDRSSIFAWGGSATWHDEPVCVQGFDQLHPYHVSFTLDLEADFQGVPALLSEVPGRVSQAVAESWRRKATHVDQAAADAIGKQSATLTSVSSTSAALARIAEDRVAAGTDATTHAQTIIVDRVLATSADSASLYLALPGMRVRLTGIPAIVFGVASADHYIIGGTEEYHIGSELFTFNTEPADAPAELIVVQSPRNDAAVIRTEDHPATVNSAKGFAEALRSQQPVSDDYCRVATDDGSMFLQTSVNPLSTTLQIQRTAGTPELTDSADDYPLTLRVDAELVRCPNPPTVVNSLRQQITGVTRGHGGTAAKSHVTTAQVQLVKPGTLALGFYHPAHVALT